MIAQLANLYTRDLERLKNEIALYNNHDNIWRIAKGISNPGGNLCLHLVGNLNTYIGDGIGKIQYVRNRELEFSAKNVPVERLLSEIDDTIVVVQKAFQSLSVTDLDKDFPVVIWDEPSNMGFTLFHLLSHLSYHLGQVNYHRRLLDDYQHIQKI